MRVSQQTAETRSQYNYRDDQQNEKHDPAAPDVFHHPHGHVRSHSSDSERRSRIRNVLSLLMFEERYCKSFTVASYIMARQNATIV